MGRNSNRAGRRSIFLTAPCAALLALGALPAAHADSSWGNPVVAGALLDLLEPGTETIAAKQSGDWSAPATWGGALPAPGDDVLIPNGVVVTYDVNDNGATTGTYTTRIRRLRVDGELRWATGIDTRLYVDTLFSSPDGVITIGTEVDPIGANRTAEIIIIADEVLDLAHDPMQLGRGFVPHGTTRVVGAEKTAHAALLNDVNVGATSITLQEAPSGWRIGDQLVLAGTWFDPAGSNSDNSRFHDEVLTITAISGASISFTANATGAGLRFDHTRPSGAHFDASELNIHVANLTRNVTFRSELDPASPQANAAPIPFPGGGVAPVDPTNFQRGHCMVMHNPDVVIRGAAFVDFGRSFKDRIVDEPFLNIDGAPGSGANQRGRYVLHLHRNLPRMNQPVDLNTATPAIIEGCVVHGGPGWGFVHHDSYAYFENNVAFDVVGTAFVQEAGNEIGLWRGNLSIKTTGDSNPEMTVEPFGPGAARVARFDFGFNGEGYWIQGAGQVVFEDNAAVSAAGGGLQLFSQVDGLGDQRDKAEVPVEHLRPEIQHIVTRGDGLIDVSHTPIQTFNGFEVANSDFGLITWGHMRNQGEWIGFTCPCDNTAHRERSRIENFRFWNIYGQGIHMQYTSQLDLVDGVVASSDLATPGVNDKPQVDLGINGEGRGYGIGMNGPTKRLHIEGVAVEGWRYGIRTPLEGQINQLDLGVNTGSEGAQGLPLRGSRFVDLLMANNDHHFYRRQNGFANPQTFANALTIDGGDFEPAPGNLPPTAAFDVESFGPSGVVRLSGLPASDPDTPTGAPNQFDVVAVSDPNRIVSYAWDFDNDGAADAHGETVVTQLPLGIASPVALTVWDHQGATSTVTQFVTPSPQPYSEVAIDGGFDLGDTQGGIYALTSAEASTGWFDARGTFTDGGARLTGQYRFSSIAQAVYDNSIHRGAHTLRFDLTSVEGDVLPNPTEVNRVTIRVLGVNGEFGSDHSGAFPTPYSAIPVEITPLFEETFSGDIPLTSFERAVDLGSEGFDYLYIGFAGSGVTNTLPDDFIFIDNVSLMGAAACPGDINGDGIVDTADLGPLVLQFGSSNAAADLNADGVVDTADLGMLIAAYGSGCP